MLPYDRQQQILKILADSGHVNVHRLAQMIHVSEPTLRRDLTQMEKNGLIRRTYGGAVLTEHTADAPLQVRREDHTASKKRIAAQAVSMITPGSVVFVDSSSTALYMLDYFSDKQKITVVTNSISACQKLIDKRIRTYCVGGLIDGHDNALRGKYATAFIRSMHIDQAFFSCSGLSREGLLTGHNENAVAFLQALLEHSAQRIFLCTYNKLNQAFPHVLCELQDVDEAICDEPLPDHLRSMVAQRRRTL